MWAESTEEDGLIARTKEGIQIPVVEEGGDEVIKTRPDRKFADVNLNAYIDKHLAALPPGDGGAAVAYLTTSGAKVAIIGREQVGPGELSWTAAATVPWSGGLKEIEAEGAVRYSWGGKKG